MKYKAVIFDMDGTLLNTIDDIYDCIKIFLNKFSYPDKGIKAMKNAMGGGAENLVRMMLPQDVSEEEFNRFFSEYIPYYVSHGKDKTAPYPGVLELLGELKEAGIKTAVVSSKPQDGAERLSRFYFNDCFDTVIGDDFNIKLKPAPDGINKVLELTGIKKEDALYVGDSEYDVLAAKNAGVDGVAVCWGYREYDTLKELKPDFLIDDIKELKRIIFE